MSKEYVGPVKHTTASATASTVVGAGSGAVKTGVKWWAVAIGIGAAIGLVASLGGIAGVLGMIKVGATTFSGPALGNTLIAVGGTIAGGLLAAFTVAPFIGGLGAWVGGFNGGAKAMDKVNQERGKAAEIQAQIDMIKAQNPVPQGTTIYAPTATNDNTIRYALPEQGSRMNPANTNIQTGSSLQYDGLAVSNQQLALH